jgi:hypothetical protein
LRQLPFDQVVIQGAGAPQVFTTEEFLREPLLVRVKWILAREVRFFSGRTPVDTAVALKAMRAADP